MLDLLLAGLALCALALSLRFRLALAAACAGAGLALLAWSSAAGVLGRGVEAYGVSGAWLLFLFGPSALPGATPGVPASALLARHPIGARLALGALFALGAALASRASGGFAHESDEADRCRRAANAFVWPALLAALPGALWALADLSDAP